MCFDFPSSRHMLAAGVNTAGNIKTNMELVALIARWFIDIFSQRYRGRQEEGNREGRRSRVCEDDTKAPYPLFPCKGNLIWITNPIKVTRTFPDNCFSWQTVRRIWLWLELRFELPTWVQHCLSSLNVICAGQHERGHFRAVCLNLWASCKVRQKERVPSTARPLLAVSAHVHTRTHHSLWSSLCLPPSLTLRLYPG